MPIGVKDNINTKDMKTTMSSEIFKDFVPKEDAFVINQLKKAGAIIIGKQNLHEFAYGPTGDRSYFGPVKNPYDTSKMAGGSSSGSAAAVASGLCFGAVGTDTGGSIRAPASFCGIVGMKPTYGRVSKSGAYPVSWTLDHLGPMTRTVHDNAIMLNAMISYDSQDPSMIEKQEENFTRLIGKEIKGKRIGIPSNFYYDNLQKDITKNMKDTLAVLEKLGAEIVHIEIPNMELISENQRKIIKTDAYAIHENHLLQYPKLLDEELKQRLLTGLEIKGYEYVHALQIRQKAKRIFQQTFEEVDIIATPTMSISPPKINERYVGKDDKNENHIRWTITRNTSPTNLNGFPSLSLPSGFSTTGMPFGIQFIAEEFGEARLYQFAYALEQELGLQTLKINVNDYII